MHQQEAAASAPDTDVKEVATKKLSFKAHKARPKIAKCAQTPVSGQMRPKHSAIVLVQEKQRTVADEAPHPLEKEEGLQLLALQVPEALLRVLQGRHSLRPWPGILWPGPAFSVTRTGILCDPVSL